MSRRGYVLRGVVAVAVYSGGVGGFAAEPTAELRIWMVPSSAVGGTESDPKVRGDQHQRTSQLFARAQAATAAKDVATAYALLWECLHVDADHAAARRALGFEKHGDAWHLPFAVQQLRIGRVWHARFGWIRQEDVPRYERGERLAGNRWVSAAEDARLHGDIRRGWQIETDHFVVTTNHSLEEGVQLATQLERLHRAWRQVFAGYWLAPEELRRRLEIAGKSENGDRKPGTGSRKSETGGRQTERARGKESPRAEPPVSGFRLPVPAKHRVTYFRDQAEYVHALMPLQPRIGMSIGVYLDQNRTAYFFAGEKQHPGTVFHEAAHQLFKESRPSVRLPGQNPNFWIVEAVACYMESLTAHDGYDALGEKDAGRLPAARERLLDDNFYVPLAELVRYTADDLHRDERIAKIYSQSAGLATFLMQFDGGRYRAPLMRYLQAVYSGKATPTTLAELTGTSYGELDRQYREYLRTTK